MTKLTYRALGLAFLSSALIAACTTGPRVTSDDDDGSSGVGGWGGATTTSAQGGATGTTNSSTSTTVSTVNSGPTTATTVTSGPMGCDMGVGNDINSVACDDCITCSQTAECSNEWSACTQNSPCGDFITCANDCSTNCGNDQTCFDNCFGVETSLCVAPSGCVNTYAAGCNAYSAALSCSVCGACQIDCDAANNCG